MEKSENQQAAASAEDVYLSYPNQLQSEERDENFEKNKADIEKRFNQLLNTISEETIQLSEFLLEEKNLVRELCVLLRNVLKRLNMTFDIPLKAVPQMQPQAKRIMLNSEGHLIAMYDKDMVDSRVLEEYPPEIVLAVIWIVIPQLEKSMKAYRKRIGDRVGIFEMIRKQLKNIDKVFSSSSKDDTEVFIVGNERLKSPIEASENQPPPSEKTA